MKEKKTSAQKKQLCDCVYVAYCFKYEWKMYEDIEVKTFCSLLTDVLAETTTHKWAEFTKGK